MSSVAPADPEKLTKKQLKADHPTWCPGCGDFTVLACFFKILEELQFPHENICTIAGMKKHKYGNIEDIVQNLRMVTPKGVINQKKPLTRSSFGIKA